MPNFQKVNDRLCLYYSTTVKTRPSHEWFIFLFVLNSKTTELEELENTNKALTEELRDLRRAHKKEVSDGFRTEDGSSKFLWIIEENMRKWLWNFCCCLKNHFGGKALLLGLR